MSDTAREAASPGLYANFRFIVRWDGRTVAGVSGVSGFDPTFGAPVTLERGVSHDDEFLRWINLVRGAGANGHTTLRDARTGLEIVVLDESGDPAMTYTLHGCWPSQFTAVPALDTHNTTVAFEALVLQCEHLTRNTNNGP